MWNEVSPNVPAPDSHCVHVEMVCSHGFADRGRRRPDVYSQMWLLSFHLAGPDFVLGRTEEAISSRYVCCVCVCVLL
jgi:hypothetical protein